MPTEDLARVTGVSSTVSPLDSMSRASAGTMRPTSSRMTSPGTSARLSTENSRPSRMTMALGDARRSVLLIARCERLSR